MLYKIRKDLICISKKDLIPATSLRCPINYASTKVRLFDYDILLYRNITNITYSQILQHDLDTLQSWESRNKMEFHPSKCTVLKFLLKQKTTLFMYKIHGTNLQTQTPPSVLALH